MPNEPARFVINIGGTLRKEMLEGRAHYVAPAAMMAEGVWNGSHGPLLYREEHLAKACPAWNYKPMVVYHPKDKDGRHVSACEPNVLNTRKIGVLLNTGYYDGKQRTECWFDIERTKSVDARIIKALENGKQIEASTGLIVENSGNGGEWNGTQYIGEAIDHRPDHFAILPDQKGAYSVADGGGVMTVNAEPERVQNILRRSMEHALAGVGIEMTDNVLSHSHIARQLSDLLSEKYGKPGKYWDGYMHDVYPDHCVFSHGSPEKTYRHSYKTKDDTVSLVGDAEEVKRVVQYQPVGNSSKEKVMAFDRKAHLEKWAEDMRTELDKLPDAVLEKLTPPAAPAPTGNAAGTPPPAATPSMAELVNAALTKPAAPAAPAAEPPKQPTFAELLANADPATRAMMGQAKKAYEQACTAAIKKIVANKSNTFSKEELVAMAENGQLETLQKMAALADAPAVNAAPPARFDYAAGIEDVIGNENEKAEPPLVAPRTHKLQANGQQAAAAK